MTEAILQGDTGKLWDLITAAGENGFINHLGLNREDASKMRGRNVVRIKASEVMKARLDDDGEPIDGTNKKTEC